MAMIKLSEKVQSLFSASERINCYKRAVEELVYNSLDAESNSIAIRLLFQEGMIQVIDNGCGVSKSSFSLLGKRYMTSKFTDCSNSILVPTNYGYMGQNLANIIEVSKIVKITSRLDNTEQTWMKTFCRGVEKELASTVVRPSKGTTVEIKGFLYNHTIQRKSINPVHELLDIKRFLEQLSLVKSNVSLSLRDDANNEIVFKVHKNRDIYQTILSLFRIKKSEVQELKVEKHLYQVTALLGTKGKVYEYNWIYLNGRYVQNCRLHKIVNDYLTKALSLKKHMRNKIKSKIIHKEEESCLVNADMPFYFIFITCPYNDYDISYAPKQSILEFKSWEQIEKLLQKLIKFYTGDLNLKEISKYNEDQENNDHEKCQDTREQVKKIMEQILGNNSKKLGVSQIPKGVKGKQIKRKTKKLKNISDPKIPLKRNINISHSQQNDILMPKENLPRDDNGGNDTNHNRKCKLNFKKTIKHSTTEKNKTIQNHSNNIHIHSKKKKNLISVNDLKNKVIKKQKTDSLIYNFEKETDVVKKRCNMLAKKVNGLLDYKKNKKREVFHNETIEYSTMVKNNKSISIRKKIDKIIIHDYLPVIPKRYVNNNNNKVQACNEIITKPFKSSYDLVQTILKNRYDQNSKIQESIESIRLASCNKLPEKTFPTTDSKLSMVPKLTFESHNYTIYDNMQSKKNQKYKHPTNRQRFISKLSRDNFLDTSHTIKADIKTNRNKKINYKTKKLGKSLYNQIKRNDTLYLDDSSYTIESLNTDQRNVIDNSNRDNISFKFDYKNQQTYTKYNKTQNKDDIIWKTNSIIDNTYNYDNNNTYTIKTTKLLHKIETNPESHAMPRKYTKWYNSRECIYSEDNNNKLHDHVAVNAKQSLLSFKSVDNNEISENDLHVIFVSESQNSNNKAILLDGNTSIEPLAMCETILSENDKDDFQNILNGVEGYAALNHNDNIINADDGNDDNATLYSNFRNVSHHFDHMLMNDLNNGPLPKMSENNDTAVAQSPILNTKITYGKQYNSNLKTSKSNEYLQTHFDSKHNNDFNFMNRLRFLPKGMSQIFYNCNTKNICDYNFEKEYYEDNIYIQFASDIKINSEIFEPGVQNVKDLTTKDIENFSKRLNKENASLVFNGQSIKETKLLRQVDNKFIAVVMKGRCKQSDGVLQLLTLFDQHAVHERIRLEKNLSEYISSDQWKSVMVDNVILRLTREEIIYLHNFREKFAQLGLQWTISNDCEVSIHAVPEAILGINPRPVDTVIKAVKNLIIEELNSIRSQKGCISLYPKSIMDLVCSEACRYAIKFGDILTETKSTELLNFLSECKTPFQCAHGRPVMAVLTEIKALQQEYKIDPLKLHRFKKT